MSLFFLHGSLPLMGTSSSVELMKHAASITPSCHWHKTHHHETVFQTPTDIEYKEEGHGASFGAKISNLECVSLHLASPPNELSWSCKLIFPSVFMVIRIWIWISNQHTPAGISGWWRKSMQFNYLDLRQPTLKTGQGGAGNNITVQLIPNWYCLWEETVPI